jgi:hypothetical protein
MFYFNLYYLDQLKETKNIHYNSYVYLYFLDNLNLRNTSKSLEFLRINKEVVFLYGIGYKERFGSCQIYYKYIRVSAFIIE